MGVSITRMTRKPGAEFHREKETQRDEPQTYSCLFVIERESDQRRRRNGKDRSEQMEELWDGYVLRKRKGERERLLWRTNSLMKGA